MNYVTYENLFAFSEIVIALITLAIMFFNSNKKR